MDLAIELLPKLYVRILFSMETPEKSFICQIATG